MQFTRERQPRILITTDAVGGVFTYVVSLAQELSKLGVASAVACMGPRLGPGQRAALEAVPGVLTFESDYPLEWMDDPWAGVDSAGEWLLGIARELEPDVVHLNGYALAALPWPAPTIVVAHSCVLSWWRAVFGCEAPPRYAEYRARVKSGLDAAARVVAPSRAMMSELTRLYTPRARMQVIGNGADARKFRRGPKQALMLAAGRFDDKAKNLDVLAQSAAQLPWPLTVVGPASPGAAAAQGLDFTGRLAPDEVAAWMARASIFLHPARYEPFGLSVLEAALSGCALVLGDIPSLRELWGDAASYVDLAAPAELVAMATLLAADSALRESMAQRALARAQRYAVARTAREYFELYAALAPRGSFSRCA